jgi:hypothetical protein
MSLPLTKDDFPLMAVGANVYRRTMSSPLFTAPTPELAAELALRLNRNDCAGYGYYKSSGELVYG